MILDWSILDKEIVYEQLYKYNFYISSHSLNGVPFFERYKEILNISLTETENQIVEGKEVCDIEVIEDAREGISFQKCIFESLYNDLLSKTLKRKESKISIRENWGEVKDPITDVFMLWREFDKGYETVHVVNEDGEYIHSITKKEIVSKKLVLQNMEVYSDIYMAENELRAFISRIMIEHFGIEWHDRPEFYKLKASIEENGVIIKRNVPNFNNIDINLYTVTLEKLMDTVKADIYSDVIQDSPEMQKLIKERIFSTTQLDRMQSALEFLKNRYVKKYNIWERFFKPLIADPIKWEELLSSFIANRNHVAHNKLLDYTSKETMLSDTRELRKFIQEAVIKFDEVNCSEEVEETLQAIEDQREYEREARMEIIESESGVKIRDKGEILKLFQDTVEEIYTDAVNKVYFDEGVEIAGDCNLQDVSEEQLLFTITGKRNEKLEIYGIVDIDDSEGATSVMEIRVYDTDENMVNENVAYINGEAEYNPEQTSYMSVVMDSYDDNCAEIIKSTIEEFLRKQREDEEIIYYEERRSAEDDWKAEAADALEDS